MFSINSPGEKVFRLAEIFRRTKLELSILACLLILREKLVWDKRTLTIFQSLQQLQNF